MHSQLLIHMLSSSYEWTHKITPKSEEIRVFATIFPMVSTSPRKSASGILTSIQDDCLLEFKPRSDSSASA